MKTAKLQKQDDTKALTSLIDKAVTKDSRQQDDLRLAVGFLDTDKLTEIAPYKSFVALVSLTRGEIQKQRKFTMPVRHLMEELGIEHNNYDRLKETIVSLMSTVVNFNTRKQDKNPGWDLAQILGPSSLEDGLIKFEFTEPVWEKLKDPIVYAYITRKGTYSFTSKHEIALYNWLTCMLVPNQKEVYCFESIEYLLKEVLYIKPIKDSTYGRYKYLNQKILAKSIEKINSQTSLQVEYEGLHEVDANMLKTLVNQGSKVVTHLKQPTRSRKISYVAFHVKVKSGEVLVPEPMTLSLEVKKLVQTLTQEGLVLDDKIEQHLLDMVAELGDAGCIKRIQQILKDFKPMKARLRNPGGFLRNMLFQQTPLEFEEASADEDPIAPLLEAYLPFLREAVLSLSSVLAMEKFTEGLRLEFSSHLPALQQLITQDKSLRMMLQNAELSSADEVLKKPSVTALLFKHRANFSYQDPFIDLQSVLLTQPQEALELAREKLPPDKRFWLQEKARQAGIRLEDIELLALDQLPAQIS
ncbi:MAG: hypothetical protein CVV27_00065 [Candidatus Melainabacteria bacterium HGW-Melainabacteria-1]|nr:MAG: hypothetical protein CVV27_00065 [Candidatus Melainabacteria bacterium HGW-Melainabacteria-1]